MDIEEAYHDLKTCIELDETTIDAYEIVVANPDEYRIVTEQFCIETKSSIKIGQSMISLGELVRQFYNATHRLIDGKLIDLPGSEFCKDIGKVESISIQQTIQINQITEEFANTQLSCNETVDISYV
jgi:hypothetical protein